MTRPIPAIEVEPRITSTVYPKPLAHAVDGRTKQKLGDHFGLINFGVNRTTLAPGAADALFHAHEKQDELFYVVKGEPTLRIGDEEHQLRPGDCIGFRAGTGVAHQIVNRSSDEVVLLEIGDRTPGDAASYPEDDLAAVQDDQGTWQLTHKDGTPYATS